MVSSGTLHDRFEVQAATITRDAHGQAVETYSTVGRRWGKLQPLRGMEIFEAQKSEPRTTHRIIMRHFPGLTSQHRLKFGTRIFHLTYVPETNSRQRIEQLMAMEAGNG